MAVLIQRSLKYEMGPYIKNAPARTNRIIRNIINLKNFVTIDVFFLLGFINSSSYLSRVIEFAIISSKSSGNYLVK
jgi:hypothetical protein